MYSWAASNKWIDPVSYFSFVRQPASPTIGRRKYVPGEHLLVWPASRPDSGWTAGRSPTNVVLSLGLRSKSGTSGQACNFLLGSSYPALNLAMTSSVLASSLAGLTAETFQGQVDIKQLRRWMRKLEMSARDERRNAKYNDLSKRGTNKD